MSGSSSISERLYLLENTDKLIFNSKWSRDRFFLNLDKQKLLSNKSIICYQSSSNVNINFKKRKN